MNTYMLLHIYEVTSLQPRFLVTTRPKLIAFTISGATRHLPQTAQSTLSAHHFRRRKRSGDSAGILPYVRSGADIYACEGGEDGGGLREILYPNE